MRLCLAYASSCWTFNKKERLKTGLMFFQLFEQRNVLSREVSHLKVDREVPDNRK